jgi:uncharacterized protein with HEPN domain
VSARMTRDLLRVTSMIQAVEEAKRNTSAGKESFMGGGLVQKAVLLDLIHLTESAERTSPGLKQLNRKIGWRRLSRLRNRGPVHDFYVALTAAVFASLTVYLAVMAFSTSPPELKTHSTVSLALAGVGVVAAGGDVALTYT